MSLMEFVITLNRPQEDPWIQAIADALSHPCFVWSSHTDGARGADAAQDMASWSRDGIAGLQSVVLYSLPELDGAIDTVPLGGLVRAGHTSPLCLQQTFALPCRRLARTCMTRAKTGLCMATAEFDIAELEGHIDRIRPRSVDGVPCTIRLAAGACSLIGACTPQVGDNIFIVEERVRRLADRLKKWVHLRRTPAKVG